MKSNPALPKLILSASALFFFLGLFAQPVITSVSPLSGPRGTTVTITGSGFINTLYNNVVYFGAQEGLVMQASPTSLQVSVPFGATYAPISVTSGGLTAYTSQPFIPTFGSGGVPISASTFPQSIDYPAGLNAIRAVVADLDHEGGSDIATVNNANSPASTISVILNTGGFIAPGQPTTLSFGAKTDFYAPPGSLPNAITYADINGDGFMDLISTSISTTAAPNMVSVYVNYSTGGQPNFSTRIDLATTSGASDVAVRDLDGDGKPDIVVTNFLSNSISIFRNTTSGPISFAPKIDLATPFGPHNVIIADLDGDGKPDIAVTNTLSGNFSVFRNQSTKGNPSFAPRVDFATGSDEPFALTAGDLDGDGKPDIVVSNYNFTKTASASVAFSTFRNSSTPGTIAFSGKTDYSSGDAFNLTLGDINGDGLVDLVVPNLNGVAVYPNTSQSGSIQLGAASNFYYFSPFEAQVADFDEDGKADLAVVDFNSSKVSILKNNTAVPTINKVIPDSAGPGLTVKLVGSNFSNVNSVSFGGVAASSFVLTAPDTIAAVVGAGATGDIVLSSPNGVGTLANGLTFVTPPTISSYTPTAGTTGDVITITGTNFTGASAISFGGMPAASFSVLSPTSIRAVIGTGTSGDVAVTTRGGTGSSVGFVFTGPIISDYTPTTGQSGTTVTINGSNFTGATAVSFGGVAATSFTVNSATSITAIVGPGASGDVLVNTPGGTGTKGGFVHVGPVITSVSPLIAGDGTPVTISGIHLTGTTAVSFGGTPAASFTVKGDTLVTAIVATGSSGSLMLTTPFGTANYTGFVFTTQPIITSLTPAMGAVGSTVAINGSNFNPTPGGNIVYFGAVRATVTSANIHQLLVTVPDAASYQPVSVTIAGFTANSPAPFDVTFTGGALAPASFVHRTDFPYGGPATQAHYAIVAGDLDGDGRPDLVTPDLDGNTISVFQNISVDTAAFAPGLSVPALPYTNDVRMNDLDGDGKLDLVSLSVAGLRWSRNTGGLNFAAPVDYQDVNWIPGSFAIGDLDGDGKPDIVASASVISLGGYLSVFRNTSTVGNIQFAPRLDVATVGGSREAGNDLVSIGDLDGDGRQDIVVSDYLGGTIYLYRNTTIGGVLSFAAPVVQNMTENYELRYTVLGDFDGDGKPDLAVGSDGNVLVFPNTSTAGNLSLGREIDINAGNNTRGMAVDDIDGDGKPDLLVVNSVANSVDVLKNTSTPGKIAFGPSHFYGAVLFPLTIAIQDLDHDSKPELIVAGYAGGFSVLHNTVGELKLSSFSPIAAGNSDTLTFRGKNFTGATAVYIGGYAAYSFSVLSDSVITAVINTAADGGVAVVTPEGVASLPGFLYLPSPYIQYTGATKFCQGDSTLLSSSIPGFVQWYKDGIAIPGATNAQLMAGATGNYTFTILINGYPRTTLPVSIQVVANPPKPVITVEGGNTLRSSATDGNQWYVGKTRITGATSATYQPDSSGNYSVRLTVGDCSSTSDVYPFVKLAPNGSGNVQIGPNPAGNYIQVHFDAPLGDVVTAKITDLSGNLLIQVDNIQNGQSIPIGQLAPGEYVLKLVSSSGKVNSTFLFTKL